MRVTLCESASKYQTSCTAARRLPRQADITLTALVERGLELAIAEVEAGDEAAGESS
jgi:hypothetical protein